MNTLPEVEDTAGEDSCEPTSKKQVKKLGPVATYFTLIKGFVCVGILYLPNNFYNGGAVFSLLVFVFSGFFTLFCTHKLIEVRERTGYRNFGEMANKIIGPHGKHLINFILSGAQLGFCCAFIYVVVESFYELFNHGLHIHVSRSVFGLCCLLLFSCLAYVRKLEVFASTHVFADIMIALTLVAVVYYGSTEMHSNGNRLSEIPLINSKFYDSFGFAIFAFEGIGTVLPIQDITAKPE